MAKLKEENIEVVEEIAAPKPKAKKAAKVTNGIVRADGVPVRKNPNPFADEVKKLYKNDEVCIDDTFESGIWCKVEDGYMLKMFIIRK